MAGYAKVADFMSKHAEMATFQRFDFLHNLDIMFLQAELVHLEGDLRDSMMDDLECKNAVVSSQIDVSGSRSRSLRSAEARDRDSVVVNDSRDIGGTPHETDIPLRSLHSQSDLRSLSDTGSESIDRMRLARDWYVLVDMKNTSTWDLVLKSRDKLKEYGNYTSQRRPQRINGSHPYRQSNTTIHPDEIPTLTQHLRREIPPSLVHRREDGRLSPHWTRQQCLGLPSILSHRRQGPQRRRSPRLCLPQQSRVLVARSHRPQGQGVHG